MVNSGCFIYFTYRFNFLIMTDFVVSEVISSPVPCFDYKLRLIFVQEKDNQQYSISRKVS